jgi:hypothetical protein
MPVQTKSGEASLSIAGSNPESHLETTASQRANLTR